MTQGSSKEIAARPVVDRLRDGKTASELSAAKFRVSKWPDAPLAVELFDAVAVMFKDAADEIDILHEQCDAEALISTSRRDEIDRLQQLMQNDAETIVKQGECIHELRRRLSHEPCARSGVGDYCTVGPASEQSQKFLLMFEDRDRGVCIYPDEHQARTAFAEAESRGWNCHLFGLLRRAAQPPPAAPPVVCSGDFARDLAAVNAIRNGYQVSDSNRVLLNFIDNLWREYSRASNTPPPPVSRTCDWVPIEHGSSTYNTCVEGEEFCLDEGLELWPHCHLCGGRIEVVDPEDEEDSPRAGSTKRADAP